MDRSQIKPYIASRIAQEMSDGDVVNLGIGLPTMIPSYLPEGVNVTLQTENGIIGSVPVEGEGDPYHVVDAGGQPAGVAIGGAFVDSATSFGLIRGGHVDLTVMGALEVDEEGSLSNWIIPGKMLPGMGGAMDLSVGAKRVIIGMEHCAKNGSPKILRRCRLPYTAVECVDLIVTERAVIKVTPEGLVLTEINPEFTVEQIVAATEATLTISPDLKSIASFAL